MTATPSTTKRRTSALAAALAGGVLVGTLAFGSVASAAGTDSSGSRQRLTIERVCADTDAAAAKMSEAATKIEGRIAELTTKLDAATAAGKTKVAARIDKRITRLEQVQTKLNTRIAQFPTWVAEHCN